jgi:hypothetical protein
VRSVVLEAGAVIAVAVMVLVAITTMALRRSASPHRLVASPHRLVASPHRGAARRGGMSGVLAALPVWGGVLVTVLLAARGKFALAAIALVATVVHAGIGRARASVALRRE